MCFGGGGGRGRRALNAKNLRDNSYYVAAFPIFERDNFWETTNQGLPDFFFCAECVVVWGGGLESCQKKAEEGDFMFVVNIDVTSVFPRTS